MASKKGRIKNWRGKKNRRILGSVSFRLHNVAILDEDAIPLIDTTIKTYNSAARCAVKRFNSIQLKELMKNPPEKRRYTINFVDWRRNEDGTVFSYDRRSPWGLTLDQWRRFRLDAYKKKKNEGRRNTSEFWQKDIDAGHPISGAELSIKDWLNEKGYYLDSTLIHEATLAGYRRYKAFISKKYRKEQPVFGDMKSRSRKRIGKDDFDLTRNSSLTVIGRKSRKGNPKFKLDSDKKTVSFVLRRTPIYFSYENTRLSNKEEAFLDELSHQMQERDISVTFTISRTSVKGKYDITLTYSPSELSLLHKKVIVTRKKNISSGIYYTDESLCHVILKNGKRIYSKIYDIDKMAKGRTVREEIERCIYRGIKKTSEIRKIADSLNRKIQSYAQKALEDIFKTNDRFRVSEVIVEDRKHRTKKNFNKGFLSKNTLIAGCNNDCFMNVSSLYDLIKGKCIKNHMLMKKANGEFVQLISLIKSNKDMNEAIVNAASEIVNRGRTRRCCRKSRTSRMNLIDWAKILPNPSMLDWVGHLLHNRRNRQARFEVRRAFTTGAVKRAARLVDNSRKRYDIGLDRHVQDDVFFE